MCLNHRLLDEDENKINEILDSFNIDYNEYKTLSNEVFNNNLNNDKSN